MLHNTITVKTAARLSKGLLSQITSRRKLTIPYVTDQAPEDIEHTEFKCREAKVSRLLHCEGMIGASSLQCARTTHTNNQ